jgi:hypothetical protein
MYIILLLYNNILYINMYDIFAISNVIDIKKNFFMLYINYNIRKYIKKLLWIPSYILKRVRNI